MAPRESVQSNCKICLGIFELTTLLNWIMTDPKSKIVSDFTKKQEVDKWVQILSGIIMGIV